MKGTDAKHFIVVFWPWPLISTCVVSWCYIFPNAADPAAWTEDGRRSDEHLLKWSDGDFTHNPKTPCPEVVFT